MTEPITDTIIDDPLDEKKFHSIKSTLVNTGGTAYHDFKKGLKPNYNKIAFDITKGWLAIAACVAAGIFIDQLESIRVKILLSLTDAAVLGFAVNYLINFFHEAAHYNIATSKNKNDLLANCFLGVLEAQHIKHYRQVHWQHHVNLGTPEDTEHSYFDALSLKFLIESLTGIRAARVFLFRSNTTAAINSNEKNAATKKQKLSMLFAGVVFHSAAILTFMVAGQYWLAGIWLLGFGTFFPFFGSLRQLLEHRGEWASKKIDYTTTPHGKLSRIFSDNAFAASFGSAGFDRHLLHHLEPQISYTNLKELEDFLSCTPVAPHLKKQKTTYLKTFITLLGK